MSLSSLARKEDTEGSFKQVWTILFSASPLPDVAQGASDWILSTAPHKHEGMGLGGTLAKAPADGMNAPQAGEHGAKKAGHQRQNRLLVASTSPCPQKDPDGR